MAAKTLSSTTMLGISDAWVDKQRLRPVLESIPLALALLPMIDEAHSGLVAAVAPSGAHPLQERLTALQQQEEQLDGAHRQVVKGVNSSLQACVLLASADKAEPYRDLLATLFPAGLAFLQGAYVAEAGTARVVRSQLTKTVQASLRAIALPTGGTLLDRVNDWLGLGDKLGQLETERAGLEVEIRQIEASEKASPTRLTPTQARNEWIAVANLLRQNLAARGHTSEEKRQLILQALDEAERKASRSAASTTGTTPPATPAAPAPTAPAAPAPAAPPAPPATPPAAPPPPVAAPLPAAPGAAAPAAPTAKAARSTKDRTSKTRSRS